MRMLTEKEHEELLAAVAERDRLLKLVNTPETKRFLEGTRLEVVHQVERWGTVHDRAKEPADWYWLVGYLAGKALRAHIDGNTEKAQHHCISTAAALANWHTHIALGAGLMTPGHSDLQEFLRATFGANFLEAQEAKGEVCPNCDSEMPGGCGGLFNDEPSCRLHKAHEGCADGGVLEGTNRTTSGAIGQP
jgi:hypothetical protein